MLCEQNLCPVLVGRCQGFEIVAQLLQAPDAILRPAGASVSDPADFSIKALLAGCNRVDIGTQVGQILSAYLFQNRAPICRHTLQQGT